MILSLSGAPHGFLKSSLWSLNTSEAASSTSLSTPMRLLPMELLSRLQFLLVRHPRRRRTYCYLMLLHSPWVSRCKVMCSAWSFHGTHLSRPTSPVPSPRSRTTRRPLRSLCMLFADCLFDSLVLRLVTVTKESGLSVVTIACLASSSLLGSLPCRVAKLSS